MIERGDLEAASSGARSDGEALLGRERELAALRAALASASNGRGRLVLLSGEAGIGKTRLADAFAVEARDQGARVAWGRCWEAGGAPVYWPWLQAVRSLLRDLEPDDLRKLVGPDGSHMAQVLPEIRAVLPELPELPDDDSDRARFQLFDSFTRLLRSASRDAPIVLILDDLHAADEPSLLLLRFVSMDLADTSVVVLAVYREGELAATDPRIGLLAEVARVSAGERLDPPGLTVDEVARYIELAGGERPPDGLAAAVHRETEGNPLFVGEIVRLLAEEGRLGRPPDRVGQPLGVTEGVKAVIGRRLARLSDPCGELLARASVIGVEIPLDLVAALEDRPASEITALLDEAVDAHVLMEPRTSGGTWRFAHALIRDVLYASLSGSVRRELHLRIARTLEAHPANASDPPLAELAHHFVLAGPAAEGDIAIDYATRGAERATAVYAHEEAARLYRLALHAGGIDDLHRYTLLMRLGDSATRAGDEEGAQDAFWEAAEIAQQRGLDEELGHAALGYGGMFYWMRAGDERLVPLLERALASLRPGDSKLRASLLGRLAGALRDEWSMERRSQLSSEAVAVARRLGDKRTLLNALICHVAAAMGPDSVAEMAELRREIRELIASTRDSWDEYQLIIVTAFGEDWSLARAEVETYRRLALKLRQPILEWYYGVMNAVLGLLEGRLQDTERVLEAARHYGDRARRWESRFSYRLAIVALRREQDRLGEVVARAHQLAADHPGYRMLPALAAYVDAATEHIDEARRQMDELAVGGFAFLPRDHGWLFGMSYLAETAILLGDAQRAGEIERMLAPYADRMGFASGEVSSGPVDRIRGLLAAFAGRHDAAVVLLENAERDAGLKGARLWVVRSRVDRARVLVARGGPGDRAVARDLVESALAACRALGLPAIEREARSVAATLDLDAHAAKPASAVTPVPRSATFRRDGDVWSIGSDRIVRLRHSKGLSYLSRLIAEPGREFHALDLVGQGTVGTDRRIGAAEAAALGLGVDAGDTGSLIDDEAKAAYRVRLRELQAELDEAEAFNDPARGEAARLEMDALEAQLSAAFGLGGRARPEGSAAERARQSVTKAIREATRRIAAEDSALGDHLGRSVRTGVYCVYDADPATPVTWSM